MNHRALALAVSLTTFACGGSAILERSAPERPVWVEVTPAARDSLYFVGVCSDLPSYQEAMRCARAEALTDVAAWVGGRFSAYVYSAQTEAARSGGAMSYFDSDLFLADVRRSDTYHEVRQEGWGRSYYVSVLIAYPRREAEAEKARIQATTARAERLVQNAPLMVSAPADEGRWGEAMRVLLVTLQEVAVPHNLQRSDHAARLAVLAEALVEPLRVSAGLEEIDPGTGMRVRADAIYRTLAAQDVPLQCIYGAEEVSVRTGSDGRALCELSPPPRGAAARVVVRPDVSGYLEMLPDEASGLAGIIGRLLDRSVSLEVGVPLDVEVSLSGGASCAPAVEILERAFSEAGVRVVEPGKGVAFMEVACSVQDVESAGELQVAAARGTLSLKIGVGRATQELGPLRGLGATRAAARDQALTRLGDELGAAALKLLRESDGKRKK